MARVARKNSSTFIYHIILRGINKRAIFDDEQDFSFFIKTLIFYKDICNYEIYAYCLMHNHVHLLMHFNNNNVSEAMKKIQDKFVYWYNKKYDRCGHLFQERFKSEPVDDERYLFTVFRYIHQNPMKAGLETNIGTYKWSSYHSYKNDISELIDVDFMEKMYGGQQPLLNHLSQQNDDYCMEYIKLTSNDAEALKLIKDIAKCENAYDIDKLDISTRNIYIKKILGCGMSERQLSRLTGISRNAIHKVISD